MQQVNLRTICNEIERKFDISVEFESDEPSDLKVTGVIDTTELDRVLSTLTALAQRSYRFEKDTYIIY